jgi:hypothetical protein
VNLALDDSLRIKLDETTRSEEDGVINGGLSASATDCFGGCRRGGYRGVAPQIFTELFCTVVIE